MASSPQILRTNADYRHLWYAQLVSEMGDWFNQVAVFTLALYYTRSALSITFILIAQTIPSTLIGPVAGVVLDRVNRKHALIISDAARAVVALGPIFVTSPQRVWWLYALTFLLASASPFFNAGRLALIPSITEANEILSANAITQATHSATLGIGSALAGLLIAPLGFRDAFLLNSLSFAGSAWFISRIRFQPRRAADTNGEECAIDAALPARHEGVWREFRGGLSYISREPLLVGILLLGVGWATGGGAMQVLFSVFGDLVFHRGAFGIGVLYGSAGIGLAVAAAIANRFGDRLSFPAYKRLLTICYLCYGGLYIAFSQMRSFWTAVLLIGLSRYFIGTSSVLNLSRMMRIIPDEFRGRVFATNETMTLTTMLLSMLLAGTLASFYGARIVALAAGTLSGLTGIWWGIANWRGRLREPDQYAIALKPEE